MSSELTRSLSRTSWRPILGALVASLAAVAASAPVSAAAPGDVTVWDTSGVKPVPCPAIDRSNSYRAKGGCAARARTGRPIRVLVRSMVGDLVFGNCSYPYTLRVDGTGRTAIDVHKVLETTRGSVCNDIRPCWSVAPTFNAEQPYLTWRGQIAADEDGRLVNEVDACLETCMGRFEGKVHMRLTGVGATSRATISHNLLGMTGVELDGHWNVDMSDVDVRVEASERSARGTSAAFAVALPPLGLGLGGGGDR